MTDDARYIALGILMDILEDGKFSHIALREGLKNHPDLPERDCALVTRLTEGTTEFCIQLDYILNAYSKIKVKKMKPLIRNILRMSAYQILYLDRIPDSAAINEAVKLAKKRGLAGLAGYVNAVLRSISRERGEILADLMDPAKTPLSVRYSLPEWLYNYIVLCYGKEEAARIAECYLSGDNETFVRTEDGRTEKMSGNIAASEAFRKGEITVQDYASQQVGLLSAPEAGDFVLDVCAAPGGKACHIASLLKGSGMVEARDLSEEKTDLIRENISRLHLKNIRTRVWDVRVTDPSLLDSNGKGKADILIADLPCSGLGIIGKKPDIRFSASLEGIRELQTLQREILKTVTAYVRPGGRMLYSTCTLTREENEQNTAWIQEEFGFKLLKEKKFLPGQPSDGFYIAEFSAPEAE